MGILKYLAALSSLLVGFLLVTIKDFYQNLVLGLFCSAIYKIGPNAGCDMIMNLPDFGFLFLFLGIAGILVSAFIDFSENGGRGV